ncbi:MAG: TPM domain-containing protein [Sandarakinorhabdus sp.]|nr:TPM domain-containing protein [Sandarakinorhabdus sp.]
MHAGRPPQTARQTSGFALLLALFVLLLAIPALAAPKFPALAGRVTDAANIVPSATEATLDARLKTLEDTTTTQLVVATVPDLQGYEIDEYGYQLGRAWGIGQKGKNNGALLIVAPGEHKVRIEVGYGLEGVLTDAVTSQIIRRDIIPHFKAGDMAGGVDAGADALIKLLELPPAERAKVVQAAAVQGSGGGGPGAGTIVWLVIIVIWIVLAISRRKRGLSAGPTIVWGPGLGGWGGGGGGGWGGGGGGGFGGGGGGFGGGGGGFGGGGSSGGW